MPKFKKNTGYSPLGKRSGFKMRSGNTPPFKQMGVRAVPIEDPLLRQGQRGITGVSDFSAMQDPAFIKSQ